jgi:hypothetical protein
MPQAYRQSQSSWQHETLSQDRKEHAMNPIKRATIFFVAILLAVSTLACSRHPVTTVSSVKGGPSKITMILIFGPVLAVVLALWAFPSLRAAFVRGFKKGTAAMKRKSASNSKGRLTVLSGLTRTAIDVENDIRTARALRDGITKATPSWEARNLLVQELKAELEQFKRRRQTQVLPVTHLRTRARVADELAAARKKRDAASGQARVAAQKVVDGLKAELARFVAPLEDRHVTALRTVAVIEADLKAARAVRGKYPEGSEGWRRHDPAVQRLKKELAACQFGGQKKKA